jgi:hypothetical protein
MQQRARQSAGNGAMLPGGRPMAQYNNMVNGVMAKNMQNRNVYVFSPSSSLNSTPTNLMLLQHTTSYNGHARENDGSTITTRSSRHGNERTTSSNSR